MGEIVDEEAFSLPAPALRPFVGFYSGYWQRGLAPASHRGLPSGFLTLVVSLETPVRLAASDRDHGPDRFEALLAGLHTRPVTISHDGRQDGLYVAVRPLGARVLFGLPAGELASSVVDLEAVTGARAGELRQRLAEAGSWPARFAVLDEVLLRGADDAAVAGRHAHRAWRRLAASGGSCGIGTLAADLGWSRRHLGTLFRRELGITPKTAARVLRFDRSRHLLEARMGLAEVAATCGFADQAHLTREWRALAGCAPTTWMAEELPNVQARPPSRMRA